jgi:hypothetical protein
MKYLSDYRRRSRPSALSPLIDTRQASTLALLRSEHASWRMGTDLPFGHGELP